MAHYARHLLWLDNILLVVAEVQTSQSLWWGILFVGKLW